MVYFIHVIYTFTGKFIISNAQLNVNKYFMKWSDIQLHTFWTYIHLNRLSSAWAIHIIFLFNRYILWVVCNGRNHAHAKILLNDLRQNSSFIFGKTFHSPWKCVISSNSLMKIKHYIQLAENQYKTYNCEIWTSISWSIKNILHPSSRSKPISGCRGTIIFTIFVSKLQLMQNSRSLLYSLYIHTYNNVHR